MKEEERIQLINEVKQYAVQSLDLSKLSNSDLEQELERVVSRKLNGTYCPVVEQAAIARQVYSSIRGLGILDGILKDDSITEVMINGKDNIFVERNGRVEKIPDQFESEEMLRNIIQRFVGSAGREVNESNPIVDTRLDDGSRVNVVLRPISMIGPVVTIRKFSKTPMTIEQLIRYGSLTRDIAEILRILVEARYNIFIAGGTGSGKTTFLNALSNYIPADERIITIEDSAELQIVNIPNLVSMQTRNENSAGVGLLTIKDLIKSSLRMRPEGRMII